MSKSLISRQHATTLALQDVCEANGKQLFVVSDLDSADTKRATKAKNRKKMQKKSRKKNTKRR